MLRWLVILTICAALAYFGSTVKLGNRTFFEHVRAVWSTDEAQDMRKGLGDKAGPALDRVKRGVQAGIEAATGEGTSGTSSTSDGGTPDAVPAEAPAPSR